MEKVGKGIGNTPLVRLKKIEEYYRLNAEIYAKVEGENLGGSIKDRVAEYIVNDALQSGKLRAGGAVIEATSGNTGIGLALVCKQKGLRAIIVMPDNMTVERRNLIMAHGGEVVLTDAKKGMQGAVEKAEELCKNTPNSIIAGQFENPVNPRAHYERTAPELYAQSGGNVDVFVAGIGTGGTVTGVGKFLKEKNADCAVYGLEPTSSPLITQGVAGAHKIQGIGANFVPKILDTGVLDGVLTVADTDAIEMTKRLFALEGLFVGISSGANVCGAVRLAQREENYGKKIHTVLPDEGGRYASILNLK